MFARRVAVVGVSLGACMLLLRCGGSTRASSTADASAAGGGGGADGAPGAIDGATDGAGDDASDGGPSGFGDDGPGPCTTDAAFPPGVGPTFACGATTCYAGSTYCFSASGGAKRGPSVLGCEPFLACGPACVDAAPSCACTAYAGSGACTCTDDAGEVFLTCSFP